MKLRFLSVVFAGVLFQSTAHAQASDFEGLSIGVNASVAHSTTKYSGDWRAFGSVSQNVRKFTGGVDASYSKAFGKSMLFGVGATYQPLAHAMNAEKLYFATQDTGLRLSSKGKNHFSVYAKPTFLLDENTAIYGKFGYHAIKLTANIKNLNGPDSKSINTNGVGFGLGIIQKLNSHVYLNLEGEFVSYSKKSIIPRGPVRLTSSEFKVGLGYKF